MTVTLIGLAIILGILGAVVLVIAAVLIPVVIALVAGWRLGRLADGIPGQPLPPRRLGWQPGRQPGYQPPMVGGTAVCGCQAWLDPCPHHRLDPCPHHRHGITWQ